MMPIAYIYFLFYLEIDEQFGITAKVEAYKEFSTKSGSASLTPWRLRRPIRL